jgi:hypothetical protein
MGEEVPVSEEEEEDARNAPTAHIGRANPSTCAATSSK